MTIHAADVWVGTKHVATLRTLNDGSTSFAYTERALHQGGPAVASTLPVTSTPVLSPGGALPAFFSNLLPEGRRLSTLKRKAKASLDDELGLLLSVGNNTIGDVAVVPQGTTPRDGAVQITLNQSTDFSEVLSSAGVLDPAALPGMQDKASARTIAVPAVAGGTEYILKVSPPEYPLLVENEAACFAIAHGLRRQLPASTVRVLHDVHGRSGLLVTRFDRQGHTRWHVEDAAQLLNLPPAMKYSPTLESVAEAVSRLAASPPLALQKIAYMTALAWLTGNGDMHAKNISVIDRGRGIEVAPLYDIPSTVPYGDHGLALSVAGSKDNLSAKKFLSFVQDIGLPQKVGLTIIRNALKATERAADRLTALDFDPRRTRDLTRALAWRRRLWATPDKAL